MGFSRQEYWSGLPFPSPGDLPSPEIKPTNPAFQADSLQRSRQGSPRKRLHQNCWACAPEPRGRDCRAHVPRLLKPEAPEPCSATRSHRNEKRAHLNWRGLPCPATGVKPAQQWRPSTAKNKYIKYFLNPLKKYLSIYVGQRENPEAHGAVKPLSSPAVMPSLSCWRYRFTSL